MKLLLLLTLLIAPHAHTQDWTSEKQFAIWEKTALSEVAKYKKEKPQQEFLLYMVAGRELSKHGPMTKAQEYYLKAFAHPYAGDKSEAVIQLVALNRDDKTQLATSLTRARRWFKENPQKLTNEIDHWLKLMEGHAKGETPTQQLGRFTLWARDARVEELMRAGDSQTALELIGPVNLTNSDINRKVRQDLLNAVVLGKKMAPPLACTSVLERYPSSLTWSMRVCRYLSDWRSNKSPRETVAGVREQLAKENPERLHWAKLLEKL
jgi:hypothetical protein